MAAPLFLKILLFSLLAVSLSMLFLFSAFDWWRFFIVFGMLLTFGVGVLTVLVGILYLPQVEWYFREKDMHVFFHLRRRFILYGLVLDVVVLPVVLLPVFKFIFDFVGAWSGFWAAPSFFGSLIFYPVALLTNLYLSDKLCLKRRV